MEEQSAKEILLLRKISDAADKEKKVLTILDTAVGEPKLFKAKLAAGRFVALKVNQILSQYGILCHYGTDY